MKRTCPLCSSQKTDLSLQAYDTEGISPQRYKYYQCHCCGLVFLFPLPSKKEMARFYQKDYFAGSRFLEIFQRERRLTLEKLKKKGRILDFGCGEGVFLDLMRKHDWWVAGFDTSTQAALAARQRYGFEVATPPLTKNSFPAQSFEAITLWHTLEHVPKPLPLLKTLSYFLADNGFLVISVPNIASFEARIGGTKWFHLDPPRHCCHYSLESLNFLLKKAGFVIIETDYFSFEYNFPGLWQTIVNRLGSSPNFFYHLVKRQPSVNLTQGEYFYSLLVTILGGLVVLAPALYLTFLLSLLGQSGSLTVFAKKKR
jgi:SAM-dependent methyltransferase